MTKPDLSWDEEAKAGYIDLEPHCLNRYNRQPIVADGMTFIVDEDEEGNIVGIEVLL